MLFLRLVSAEYIKLLASDMYVGLDKDSSLMTVHRNTATRFSRESVNDELKSPFTKINGPQGQNVVVDSFGKVKLSADATGFQIVMSNRGGFLISKGDKCLGHGNLGKIELGSCSDGSFNNLFLFVNSRNGSRADVRMKSRDRVLDVKPVISFGKHFLWSGIRNTDIQTLLSPFSSKPTEKDAKSSAREFVKFNEF